MGFKWCLFFVLTCTCFCPSSNICD
jgi:hypothetical protein